MHALASIGSRLNRPLSRQARLVPTSTGVATLDPEDDRLSIDGGGRLEGRGWAELDPRLREIDELIFEAEIKATKTGDVLDAEELIRRALVDNLQGLAGYAWWRRDEAAKFIFLLTAAWIAALPVILLRALPDSFLLL